MHPTTLRDRRVLSGRETPSGRPYTHGVHGDAVTNLAQLAERHAADRGGAEALVQPYPQRRALTWGELNSVVDAVASGYAERGLRAGHRIGLCGPNSVDLVVCYLAALRAGLVAVPLDPAAEPNVRDALIAELGVKLVLGVDAPLRTADLARPDGGVVVSPPDAEALAVLLRSAGTDGDPHWAMLTHRALLAPLAIVEALDPDATALAALPLWHVFGLTTVLSGWLGAGARLVLAEPYGDQLASVIAAEGIDILPATPAMLLRLLRSDPAPESLAGLRWVLAAGAAVPDWLAEEFQHRTGRRIERGYGLTETAAGVTATFGGPVLGPNHVGRPLPGIEVRIGDGGEPGDPGLIAVRGANLFSGYWPDADGGPDADGWFVTDDLGYVRGDELFLLDRSREVVVVQGFPVYPAEVEQVLREVPAVTGAAAVGVPDERRGMRIVAYVTGDVSVDALSEHCRRLAPYKRPTEIHVVDDLPRGALGEVQRPAVRSRHRLAGADT